MLERNSLTCLSSLFFFLSFLPLPFSSEEASEGTDSEEEAASGDDASSDGEASDGADVPDSGTYRLTSTVNIRSSASEDADRIGVGYSGDEVEILMKQSDGWTKVRFKGETGYIRTDVLQ